MSNSYWEKRAIGMLGDTLESAMKCEKYLDLMYINALDDILRKYYTLVRKYKNDSDKGLDVEQIKKDRILDPQFMGKLIRCEEEFTAIAKELGNRQIKTITDLLNETVTSTYNGTMEIMGVKDNVYSLNKRAIETMVKTPFASDGKIFSQRIWGNVDNLESQLKDTLTNSIIRGDSIYKTADKLKERTGVSNSNCRRIVRTETVACFNKASLQAYKDAGIEYVDLIVEPDACPKCKSKEKLIKISEAVMGKNIPVFHPHCRCAICGHFED